MAHLDIDEAIKHCNEKAAELKAKADQNKLDVVEAAECLECAEEHRQLAAWLTELKHRREIRHKGGRVGVKILDTQTGRIHEYGENCHDSLYVSNDGRYLTYYNLQNGDGSGVGDYRFVCDDGKVPAESQTADAIHAEVYFNIGGFSRNTWHSIEHHDLLKDHEYCLIVHKDWETPIKAKYHADGIPHFTFFDSENGMQAFYITDNCKVTHFMFMPDMPKGDNV